MGVSVFNLFEKSYHVMLDIYIWLFNQSIWEMNTSIYLYGLWCGIFCFIVRDQYIAPHVYDDRHIQCRITVFNIHLINYRFFLQFLDCLCFCYILTVCDIYVLKSKLQRLFDVTWSHEDVMCMFVDKNILWHILLLTRPSKECKKEVKQAPTICDRPMIYS